MNFDELVEKVNNLNVEDQEEIKKWIETINIDDNNFNQWVQDIFSDKIDSFDMEKLPYVLDELYQTTDKYFFMLFCMLLESSCDKLAFLPNIEQYPLFVAKFESLINTLVTVYDRVDNGIANCMALIIIKNDPEFHYFNEEQKSIIVEAAKRKLRAILDYLKRGNINPIVYYDLEVIIDLSCYLKNNEITNLISEIDQTGDLDTADIYVMKYNVINHRDLSMDKLNHLKQDPNRIWLFYNVMEQLGVNNTYLKDVSQETLALSNMIKWLDYPTELGSKPDQIELLGEFVFNNTKCYAYSFSKEGFKIPGNLLGISGGFPLDHVSSNTSGYTFSKFEAVSSDWQTQATELAQFIYDCWVNQSKNQ